MYFLRGLIQTEPALRIECPHSIWLPPPIQSQTFPSQSWWPWGTETRNFACLQCKQVYEYSAPNSRWERVDSTVQLEESRKTAVYLLSVPCGIERCAGLIDILVVAKKELTPSEGNEIAHSLYARAAVCGNGHRTTGPPAGRSLIAFGEVQGL
jgi:hypothetical protein